MRTPKGGAGLANFAVQFVLITTGILMTLVIDSLIEARRQKELVAEAHAAIAAEIADNAMQLDNALPYPLRALRQ